MSNKSPFPSQHTNTHAPESELVAVEAESRKHIPHSQNMYLDKVKLHDMEIDSLQSSRTSSTSAPSPSVSSSTVSTIGTSLARDVSSKTISSNNIDHDSAQSDIEQDVSRSRYSLPEPLSRHGRRQMSWPSKAYSKLFIDCPISAGKIYKRCSDSSLPSSHFSVRSRSFTPPASPRPVLSDSSKRRAKLKRRSHSTSIGMSSAAVASLLPVSAGVPKSGAVHSAPVPPPFPESSTSASTTISITSPSAPAYSLQPPPVNSVSLREIDLQEIFKNPQLRHDIVFDPQLQFRPYLDGERGRRKRAITEKYWESVVLELEFVISRTRAYVSETMGDQSFDSQENLRTILNTDHSRLPLLFTTLKDILMSLLPTKDRPYADSILDNELIVQQLSRGVLDFVALARWLSFVFKAHCAPMRDAWVDQMVERIELGVSSGCAKYLVEGLRMIFAILEAMKLDVANHQIRSLRPVLVSSAVEFEQEYYMQCLERGKIDVCDCLDWFERCTVEFGPSCSGRGPEKYRQIFVHGALKLITCYGSDIVSEFPSTFGFDCSRLCSFRAELRKIVCLNLCVLLYQQLVNEQCDPSSRQQAELYSAKNIDKLKGDILAIVGDSMGNAKWTKNTSALGLEVAERAFTATDENVAKYAPVSLGQFATGWLCKQLQPRSKLYGLLEKRARGKIFHCIMKNLTVFTSLDCNLPARLVSPSPGETGFLDKECAGLASRMTVLMFFHWAVFGKRYISHVSQSKATSDVSMSDVTAETSLTNKKEV